MPASTTDTSPDVYLRLQARIDQLSVPFPATESGVEIRLLRTLFDEDEAEIAIHLSASPEPLDVIARRVRAVDRRDLGKVLLRLSSKGAINAGITRVGKRRLPTFGLAPLVVGMFEFQVDRLSPQFVEDFHQYLDEGFRSAVVGRRAAQMRTVPIRADLTTGRTIARYENIRDYLARHPGPFSVINCVCRQSAAVTGGSCTTGSSHETCLMIGSAAAKGRAIDHDELLSILDRAERQGHVLQPQNSREPAFVCCCCRDCCEVLRNARKLPRPADALPTPYRARVNVDRCTGCRVCVKRCPMDAMTVSDRVAHVDEDRCIGCGLCGTSCADEAISLARRRERVRTPRNTAWMHARMFAERRGLPALVGLGVKKVLGRRI
jgi:ferredoxin